MRRAIEPFIPPFLRVNEDTWKELPTRRQVVNVLASVLWILGLYYAQTFDAALLYAIISGFIGIFLNLGNNTGGNADRMSAYSVFNKGAQRMLGSLSAEQFENEIRHRQPHHDEPVQRELQEDADDLDAEEERNIQLAIRLSLEESKKTAAKGGKKKKRR